MAYLIAWSIHTNGPYSAWSISHLIADIQTWLCLLFLAILVGLVDSVQFLSRQELLFLYISVAIWGKKLYK